MIFDRYVVPFKRWHYEWLASAGAAAEGHVVPMENGFLLQLEKQNSWTGVVDGTPLICAGTMLQWPGRHTAWAYVARGTLRHLPWMTEQVRKNLEGVKGRIDFTVRADFPAGQRWAKSIGFEIETPVLKQYGPEGEDHIGYFRIN